MSLESVGGVGFAKIMLDDTSPPKSDVDHHYQTFLEEKSGALLITIRITKASGRSYDTQTLIPIDALEAVLDALGLTFESAKFPH